MNKDSLSVIVPVYNAESTLQKCLDSILSQSYQNFELVLVDDGSTDQSAALCNEYGKRDKRIKVVHIKNSGPFQARKQGAKRASGNILTFSDADDFFEKNAFETAMQIFHEHNPDILAYTYGLDNGKAERHLYEEGLYWGEEIRTHIIPGMMYDSAYGGRRLNPSLCCKLIKRELFTRVTESVKDRITLGDDAIVTYPAVCLAESIFICNQPLYHYHNNPLSCTHSYPLERIGELKAFQDNIMRLFGEMGMLAQVGWQAENYMRSFFAVMIRNWYGMELSPVMFRFPYPLVPKGARVFLYGAGNVGKSYINELKDTQYAEIAGWADKNYGSIKEYRGVAVTAPEQIPNQEFARILIAVWEEETAKKIAADLLYMGVDEKKIIWTKPMCII